MFLIFNLFYFTTTLFITWYHLFTKRFLHSFLWYFFFSFIFILSDLCLLSFFFVLQGNILICIDNFLPFLSSMFLIPSLSQASFVIVSSSYPLFLCSWNSFFLSFPLSRLLLCSVINSLLISVFVLILLMLLLISLYLLLLWVQFWMQHIVFFLIMPCNLHYMQYFGI